MSQEKTAVVESNLENLSANHHGHELQSELAFNPMRLWGDLIPGLHIEYQQVEIRLQSGSTYISGKKASYRDGVINQESIHIQGPGELYLEAVHSIQRHTQSMLKVMLMPWVGLMQTRDSETKNP